MKKLIEFNLNGGDTLVVEVDTSDQGGVTDAGRFGDIAEKAELTFEETLEKLRPLANGVISKLKDLSPEKVVVEFGVKLSAKSGIILASADSEVNLKIAMEWHSQEKVN
jgi:hypothetical protein